MIRKEFIDHLVLHSCLICFQMVALGTLKIIWPGPNKGKKSVLKKESAPGTKRCPTEGKRKGTADTFSFWSTAVKRILDLSSEDLTSSPSSDIYSLCD